MVPPQFITAKIPIIFVNKYLLSQCLQKRISYNKNKICVQESEILNLKGWHFLRIFL